MEIKKKILTRPCAECEEPIPLERLKVVPEAVMCIICAEEEEREWGCHKKTMEVVVNGTDFDDYDGCETFITSGKWVKPRPK